MSGSIVTPTRRALLGAAATLAAPAVLGAGVSPAQAKAPPLGPTAPTHHRFTLGSFEATTVVDAAVMIDGPWPIVGEDRPAAEIEALMRDNLLPEKRFRPGFTPTLINTGRELVLFDAGNGENGFVPPPAGGRLAQAIESAGYAAEQVDLVALTHCHPDHIGGLMRGGEPLFPNARYVLGGAEHAFWSKEERLSAPAESNELKSAQMFRKIFPALADRASFVRPGGEVTPGIVAVEAYGHTPGHLAFHVESGGERLLIWGDCAHHEVASLAHPEWSAFFDMDKKAGAKTRRRIYDMAATERLAVIGYHTSFPSVGFVERRGTSGYRWLPATYQFAD
jgi:glyoxylase-like metal-dependent hydrolase (beta-lactamase superfamily II)